MLHLQTLPGITFTQPTEAYPADAQAVVATLEQTYCDVACPAYPAITTQLHTYLTTA
jgi:hypothetical protein